MSRCLGCEASSRQHPRFVFAECTDEWDFPVSLVPPGTASEAEEDRYASILAAFASKHALADTPMDVDGDTGPSTPRMDRESVPSSVTTAIVTPAAPDVEMAPERSARKRGPDSEPEPKPRKRIRWADE